MSKFRKESTATDGMTYPDYRKASPSKRIYMYNYDDIYFNENIPKLLRYYYLLRIWTKRFKEHKISMKIIILIH